MNTDAIHTSEPASKDRLRLWLRLLKLTGRIESEVRRRLRDEHDTTLPRFDVMAALRRHPEGLKMSELSQYLRVSNGNVTGIVDRLTKDGLALRLAVPGDRRAQLVRLTPAGATAFDRLAADHERWIDELLGSFEPSEALALSKMLTRTEETDHGRTQSAR